MRILFTRFPLKSAHGGAENQTMWLAEGLRDLGHHVSFLGSCPVLLEEFAAAGFETTGLDVGLPPVTKWSAINFLWRRKKMQKILIEEVKKLLTTHYSLHTIVMLSLTEKLLLTQWAAVHRIKVLWIEHDRIGRWLTKNPWLKALKKASTHATIVCVSDRSRTMMTDLGFDPKKVIAIPNGVPMPSPPSPTSSPSERPSSPGPFSRGEKGGAVFGKTKMNPRIFSFAKNLRKSQTNAEEILWSHLRDRQLCHAKFRRQHPIQQRILDFYSYDARLGIELDGGIHNEEEQKTYDQERSEVLSEFDIRILRFRNEEILENVEKVLKEISKSLSANAPSLISSPLPSGEGLGVRVPRNEGEGLGVRVPRNEGEGSGVREKRKETNLTLGCISRLSSEKGVDILIQSLESIPEVTLTIIGQGRDESYLRQLIAADTERMGGSRIDLRSSVEDLDAFYASLDALVLPSSDHDPFGLVAAEAMIRGAPVIVTDACGIAGYLEDGEDALIVPAGSPLALAGAIKHMLDPSVRSRLARLGQKKAEKIFSLSRMVDGYAKIFFA